MKKRSLWILFLTALLCLSVLFAACDSDAEDIEGETSEIESGSEIATDTQAEDPTETEAPQDEVETEARPVDAVVNYQGAIDVWEAYFSYVAGESEKPFTGFELIFSDIEKDIDGDGYEDTNTNVSYDGSIYKVTKTTWLNGMAVTSVTLYNVETGKKILSATERYDENTKTQTYDYNYNIDYENIELEETVTVNEGTYDEPVWTTKTYSSWYNYDGKLLAKVETSKGESCEINDIYGMFREIIVTRYVNKGTEEEPDWQYVTTYSYYDKNDVAIEEGLSERAYRYTWGNDWNEESQAYEYFGYITIDGTNFYFNQGEIIFADEEIDPVMIPADFNTTGKLGSYNGFNYYKYNGTIQVVDTKTYKIVAKYVVPAHMADYEVEILANGNVYVHSYAMNEDIFDCEYVDGSTYLLHNVILDITTGVATEVEVPYIIINMETPASLDGGNMSIKDECNYAEVLAVKDGKISSDVEFVILNSKLETLVTLPKFAKNQISFDGMVGESRFEFGIENIDGVTARYIADGKTNTVTPKQNGTYWQAIENGFIIATSVSGGYTVYTIYNNDLEQVAELTSMQSPSVVDGIIHFYDREEIEMPDDTIIEDAFVNDTKPNTTIDYVYKFAYVDENGEYYVKTVSRDRAPSRVRSDLDLWTTRYGDPSSSTPNDLYFYNGYGQLLKILTDVEAYYVAYMDENTVLLEVDTTNGTLYYIIK